MRLTYIAVGIVALCGRGLLASHLSTAGIEGLLKRRLPNHADQFEFSLASSPHEATPSNDTFEISNADYGKIRIEGTSISAILTGYVDFAPFVMTPSADN